MNLAYKLSTAKTGGPALASAAQLVLMLTFLLLALPVSAAAQIAQFSYAQRGIGSGFFSPDDVTMDANGDDFVADSGNGLVKEVLAVNGQTLASPTILTLGGTASFNGADAIAVDAAGNLYIADSYSCPIRAVNMPRLPGVHLQENGAFRSCQSTIL
jgi:hypothetical protein